jgi:hypothetical protein
MKLPTGGLMRNPRHPRTLLVTLTGIFMAALIMIGCNQTKETAPTPQQAAQIAPAGEKVYVIFEGPWAIVPDPKNANSVLALAPKTKSHRDLVVQTWDKVLPSGIYDLSLPARTGTAEGTVDPNILQAKIDPQNVQHVLDNKLERYAIRLPKPDAYVAHTHYRSRAGSTYPPDASREKDYVTIVSLRYNVTSLNGFSLAGSPDSGTFNPLLLQVETPTINFVIHPAHDPDLLDRCNTHSRESFRDLTRLLNIALFVDFPNDPSECHRKDPQNVRPVKAGIDRRSVLQRVAFAGEAAESLKRRLLAAVYLFGANAGACRAPIIVGN